MRKLLLFWMTCLLPTWGHSQVSPADSLTPATGPTQSPASTYRYVNATSLTLRSLPDASSAAITTIGGASRVQLVRERADGWSQVQVLAAVGYVTSAYLIEAQETVTAAVDWATVEAAGGLTYSSLFNSRQYASALASYSSECAKSGCWAQGVHLWQRPDGSVHTAANPARRCAGVPTRRW